jgi:hypothetical protein
MKIALLKYQEWRTLQFFPLKNKNLHYSSISFIPPLVNEGSYPLVIEHQFFNTAGNSRLYLSKLSASHKISIKQVDTEIICPARIETTADGLCFLLSPSCLYCYNGRSLELLAILPLDVNYYDYELITLSTNEKNIVDYLFIEYGHSHSLFSIEPLCSIIVKYMI